MIPSKVWRLTLCVLAYRCIHRVCSMPSLQPDSSHRSAAIAGTFATSFCVDGCVICARGQHTLTIGSRAYRYIRPHSELEQTSGGSSWSQIISLQSLSGKNCKTYYVQCACLIPIWTTFSISLDSCSLFFMNRATAGGSVWSIVLEKPNLDNNNGECNTIYGRDPSHCRI